MVQGSRQHRRMPATLHASTQQCLQESSWRGNIRELKNVGERLVVRDMERPIEVEDLPEEIRGVFVAATFSTQAGPAPNQQCGLAAPPAQTVPNLLWRRMEMGETFWACVAEPFRNHDLTRDDIRALVRRGLDETHGSYRALLRIFNLPDEDYKRVLSFLRQHDCHVPFQRYLAMRSLRASTAHLTRGKQAVS